MATASGKDGEQFGREFGYPEHWLAGHLITDQDTQLMSPAPMRGHMQGQTGLVQFWFECEQLRGVVDGSDCGVEVTKRERRLPGSNIPPF